jgi:hypothetical protein
LEVDLFGDPCLPPDGGRGRPVHQPTRETRNRVLLGLVRGLTAKEIARSVGLSVPTLRKHYFFELQQREHAALKMEMRQLELLVAEAEKGSVAANKELDSRLQKLRMRDQHRADAPRPAKQAAAKPLGKKEQQHRAALEPSELYDAPPPPASSAVH